jgi:hypothetical protein
LFTGGAHSIGRNGGQFGIDRKIFENESGGASRGEELMQRVRQAGRQMLLRQADRGVAKGGPGLDVAIVRERERAGVEQPSFAIAVGKAQNRVRLGEDRNGRHFGIILIVT